MKKAVVVALSVCLFTVVFSQAGAVITAHVSPDPLKIGYVAEHVSPDPLSPPLD